MVDMHVAERKLNSLSAKQCIVTACHRVTPQLATIVLFHLFVINEQYLFFSLLFLFNCHNGCAPRDASAITSPDLLY